MKPTDERLPDEMVWRNGLRWVEGARMQLLRLEDAFSESERAFIDARTRHELNKGTNFASESREQSDANFDPFDPQRPLRVPSWALYMQVATELDLLVVSLRNVMRAQERIPTNCRPEMTGQEIVKHLRNAAEHYDTEGWSARALTNSDPDFLPYSLLYYGKDIWIGGEQGIPLSRIEAWVGKVRTALDECLANVGQPAPEDLMASIVKDDDALPWPQERLRYHWSIPQVSEQEWPRQKFPAELSEAIAELFARRRMRDSWD